MDSALQFASFTLDRARQQLWRGAVPVPLPPKAWQLLLYLLQRPGVLVPTDELLDALWPQGDVMPKALTNRIVELRQLLGDDPAQPHLIETVHRRGYRFIAPVVEAPAQGVQAAQAAQAELAEQAELAMPVVPQAAAAPRIFVGRDAQLQQLAGLLTQARQGQRQVALVRGDAGLGKSALVDAFLASPAARGLRVGHGPCVEQSGERESFGPFLALLGDLANGPERDQVLAALRRCAPSWLLQLPWLLGDDEAARLRSGLLGSGAARMLREGCALLEALSQQRPLLLVLDDLHWADAASLDLLAFIAQGRSAARLLLVATYRPVDAQLHGQALPALADRLAAQQRAQIISLQPLEAPQVQAWLDHRFGQAHFSGQLAPWLQRQSAGNPLLLGATVAALVDDGSVRRDGEQWQLARAVPDEAPALPQPLAPLVAARLALLSALQREVLEAASVVGMQCSMQLLQAALQRPVHELEEACRALAERQLFLQPLPAASWPDGSTAAAFAFEHDLWRRAIYEGIALARRQVLHQRVAERLEAGWGARASEVAGPLAVAYERANQPEACARVLEMAAGVCVARFAYREAIDNLQAALQQWARLDASPARAAVEARLQLGLANLRTVGRGDGPARAVAHYAAAEAASVRADMPRLRVRALLGLCISQGYSGRAAESLAVAERLLALALREQPALASVAHTYLAIAALGMGRLQMARQHLERALQLPCEPDVPALIDSHVLAHTQLARTLGHLGCPQDAWRHWQAALARSQSHGSPVDRLETLYWASEGCRLLGDPAQAARHADELLRLAASHALPLYRMLAQLGHLACQPAATRNLPELAALVQALQEAGERWGLVGWLLLLARTQQAQGLAADARCTLDQAFAHLDAGRLHEAELHALRAELLTDAGADAAAVSAARDAALAVTRAQLAAPLHGLAA